MLVDGGGWCLRHDVLLDVVDDRLFGCISLRLENLNYREHKAENRQDGQAIGLLVERGAKDGREVFRVAGGRSREFFGRRTTERAKGRGSRLIAITGVVVDNSPQRIEGGYNLPMAWQERVSVNPAVRSGKPCIKGTRITVYDVLEYLAGGMTEDAILSDFPDLTREDIRAALAFAAARERRLTNSVA